MTLNLVVIILIGVVLVAGGLFIYLMREGSLKIDEDAASQDMEELGKKIGNEVGKASDKLRAMLNKK
jgi:hypothetical protein